MKAKMTNGEQEFKAALAAFKTAVMRAAHDEDAGFLEEELALTEAVERRVAKARKPLLEAGLELLEAADLRMQIAWDEFRAALADAGDAP